MSESIVVEGIETNNLKDIDIALTKRGINLIVGPSGSGKSSLAYDTVAQIGQHEFMSMFADDICEPSYKVRSFKNMIAAVPISQSNYNNNMRSTIGTYFGLNRSIGLIYAVLLDLPEDFFVLNKESNLCEACHGLGYVSKLDYNKIIDFNIPLNKVPFKCWNRYKDFFGQMISLFCQENKIDAGKTFRELSDEEKHMLLYGESTEKFSVRYKKVNAFSRRTSKYFGVLTGMPMLPGMGVGKSFYSEFECECCHGKKYNKSLEEYKVAGLSIGEFMTFPFADLKKKLSDIQRVSSGDKLSFTVMNVRAFVDKAVELNLGHLCFHRAIPTLSGGELQRLRLVQVFNTQLTDLMIVLDEPLAGLSGEEKRSVYDNVISLSRKHTVVLVDHGDTFLADSSNTIALGEKGGKLGGYLIDAKNYFEKQKNTEPFDAPAGDEVIRVELNSSIYQYTGVNMPIIKGRMNLITGYSGVGKSTLLREYLPQYFNRYVYINQRPLMGNKNSSVATALDIATRIAELFGKKYKKDKRFFSNLTGNDGMCPACAGAGYTEYGSEYHQVTRIECKECEGTGFNKALKKFRLKGKSVFDIWKMTLEEASDFFEDLNQPITDICKAASDVMLGHLQIGQATGTLSGGENIRIKLLGTSKTKADIIGVDEPFKGLSNTEIYAVALFLDHMRERGKTILVVDHSSGIEKYFSHWIRLELKDNILQGKVVKTIKR